MSGMPLMVVAKNFGHADTRMTEKHYGHLAPSYIADAIRAHAPRFGMESEGKVRAIQKRRVLTWRAKANGFGRYSTAY